MGKLRESGARVRLTCNLPLTGDAANWTLVTKGLELALVELAGGFTSYLGTGSWRHPETSIIERDNLCIFVVSIEPDDILLNRLKNAFLSAASVMGQEWVHMEVDNVLAHHTHVNALESGD